MTCPLSESGSSPTDIVRALRARALTLVGFADAVDSMDRRAAAVAREEAVGLRCHAAVIEQLAELHNELSTRARLWDTFAARLRGSS